MIFNYARHVFSATILIAGLFTASLSVASTILGDNFTVTVSEESVPLSGSDSGVAGSVGKDINCFSCGVSISVDWIDGDTFKLDFYSGEATDLQNLQITLADLDFVHNGVPVDIIGVTALPLNDFNWAKDVSFTANSITIGYQYLDTI